MPETVEPSQEQTASEFAWMLERVRGAKSILEVGSRTGHSLAAMALVAVPGARVCTIDQGLGDGYYTAQHLWAAVEALKDRGYDAHLCIFDSHEPMALEWAKKLGPFDFVFIDGDHSYAGVKQDWEWYGALGKVVGFHDIGPGEQGPQKLWRELKDRYETEECIHGPKGIGILRNGKPC